jgi:hypothetical protein
VSRTTASVQPGQGDGNTMRYRASMYHDRMSLYSRARQLVGVMPHPPATTVDRAYCQLAMHDPRPRGTDDGLAVVVPAVGLQTAVAAGF